MKGPIRRLALVSLASSLAMKVAASFSRPSGRGMLSESEALGAVNADVSVGLKQIRAPCRIAMRMA